MNIDTSQLPSLEALKEEQEKRLCKPNEFTGVAPELIKCNGRTFPIPPKMRPVYNRLGLIDGEEPDLSIKFIICVGGRSGSKSKTVGHAMKEYAMKEERRILCTREIQLSIKDSVHQNISDWIKQDDDGDKFRVTDKAITCTETGSDFMFKGMKSGTSGKTESIKSLENISAVWFEEAQTTNISSLRKLIDTIRVDDCVIIFCMNTQTDIDAVPHYLAGREDVLTIDINYIDNPFLPKTMWVEAEHAKNFDYDEYLHVWMGQVKEQNPESVVLPAKWLKQCIGLHTKLGIEVEGKVTAGFDVADGETAKHDSNAFGTRSGSVVTHAEKWQMPFVYDSCKHVDNKYMEYGYQSLTYDVSGMGVAAKSDFEVISREKGGLPYVVRPFNGAGAVHGGDTVFVAHGAVDQGEGNIITNKQFFKNAKTQQWWNLRLRLENSMKLIKGLPVNRDNYFLSFDDGIENIDEIIRELSQATYKEDGSGRKMIDKAPAVDDDTGRRSPNFGDMIGYAFSDDFKHGLRASNFVEKKEENQAENIRKLMSSLKI